jgi:hypothetical protein
MRYLASRSKWPRLRSATGFDVLIGRGGTCGAAAHSSPPSKTKTNGHLAACPPWREVEVKLYKIWLAEDKRISIKRNFLTPHKK